MEAREVIRGVLQRFARKGENKIYLTLYNGNFIVYQLHHGVIVKLDDFDNDKIEATAAFERARNEL